MANNLLNLVTSRSVEPQSALGLHRIPRLEECARSEVHFQQSVRRNAITGLFSVLRASVGSCTGKLTLTDTVTENLVKKPAYFEQVLI